MNSEIFYRVVEIFKKFIDFISNKWDRLQIDDIDIQQWITHYMI